MPTSQTNPKTVWSSEDGDLRKKLPPPASPKSDTESLENIKNLDVGFGGGARRAEGVDSPPQQQAVYLHRESKGRGGKAVTLVQGLVLSEVDMSALAKKIKQACGSGGTVKDGVIEIQGENREKIADTLRKLGTRSRWLVGDV